MGLPGRSHRGARPLLAFRRTGTLILLATALVAARPVLAQAPPSVPINSALLNAASLDSILRPVMIDRMADRYVAGAAIAVVSGDQIVYQEGFGRREVFREVPVDVDRTIWRIGSVTKVLTGLAVMQLVDRGLLRLDDEVTRYLGPLHLPSTFSEPIRVRHLLTHTAGFDQLGTDRHAPGPEAVRPLGEWLATNLVRLRPPGQLSVYDTYGISLAGYLVERLSGLGYEEYLTRNLFQPLGMPRSGIAVPEAQRADLATGYEFAGHWEAMPWEYMNTAPASTVNATVPEMAHLLVMLLNDGRYQGRQLMSEASVRAMLTRQFSNDPEQPGYGLTFWEDRSFGIPAFSHGGSMTGFGSFLYLVPEHRFGVYIAYNQESSTLAESAVSALVAALFPSANQATALRPRFVGDDDVARFAGSYANAIHNHRDPAQGWRRRPFEVTVKEAGEVVFERQPARRVGPLAFQRENGTLVTFRQNDRNEITHMFVGQSVFERIR